MANLNLDLSIGSVKAMQTGDFIKASLDVGDPLGNSQFEQQFDPAISNTNGLQFSLN